MTEPSVLAPGKAGYHHGDLRNALLLAAEDELAEKGMEAFSLRGVAKRAGVSHAAPAHHFRDTNAMLTALASIAMERLTQSMLVQMAKAGPGPRDQFIASGVGYVRFALGSPALFKLMFGSERPDSGNMALKQNAGAAFTVLVDQVRAITGKEPMLDDGGRLDIAVAWSVVHGVSTLLIADRMAFMNPLIERDFEATIAALIARLALPAASARKPESVFGKHDAESSDL